MHLLVEAQRLTKMIRIALCSNQLTDLGRGMSVEGEIESVDMGQ